jgi:hypothetical protein
MSKIDRTIQRNEEELLNFDISDDALEGAAGADAIVDYTYYGCTSYSYCPGY